jgi:hypothetical protein
MGDCSSCLGECEVYLSGNKYRCLGPKFRSSATENKVTIMPPVGECQTIDIKKLIGVPTDCPANNP